MIIGLGCDIVELSRFVNAQDSIAKRILSDTEWSQYRSYHGHRQLEFLAGHFAAKEALIKALPQVYNMQELSIIYRNHKPCVDIKGYAISLSISHEKEYATSVAVVESVEG